MFSNATVSSRAWLFYSVGFGGLRCTDKQWGTVLRKCLYKRCTDKRHWLLGGLRNGGVGARMRDSLSCDFCARCTAAATCDSCCAPPNRVRLVAVRREEDKNQSIVSHALPAATVAGTWAFCSSVVACISSHIWAEEGNSNGVSCWCVCSRGESQLLSKVLLFDVYGHPIGSQRLRLSRPSPPRTEKTCR